MGFGYDIDGLPMDTAELDQKLRDIDYKRIGYDIVDGVALSTV